MGGAAAAPKRLIRADFQLADIHKGAILLPKHRPVAVN
jgi:hypothetical protein